MTENTDVLLMLKLSREDYAELKKQIIELMDTTIDEEKHFWQRIDKLIRQF